MKIDEPYYSIPEKPDLPRNIYESIYKLAKLVESEKGTENGITALLWSLIRTVQNHIKEE